MLINNICEMRHIDMLLWSEIQADIPMSRSQVNKRYNKAMGILMKNKRVKRMIDENRDAYISWRYEKAMQRVKKPPKINTPPTEAPDV